MNTVLNAIVLTVWFGLVSLPASGQPVEGGVCKPVSERNGEVGCWIIAHEPVGQIAQSETLWHLDTYPTRAAAEAAKGPRGTVVESLGKIWLLTIETPVGAHLVEFAPEDRLTRTLQVGQGELA